MTKYIIPPSEKQLLVTPGPTPTPESVRLLMAKQMIHHRTPEFSAIFKQAQEGLQWLFQTKELPIVLTCSGTGAFEAALQSFTRPNDRQLAVGGGKFGERWGLMGESLGLQVETLDVEWGRVVSEVALREKLSSLDTLDVLTVSVSETSTGVLHDLPMIIRTTKEFFPEALLGVDAVTALGVHDLPFDDLDVDFMISGSQKALALPPGLGFVVASPRAWSRAEKINEIKGFRRSFYFDLLRERKKQLAGTTAFTPALTLVIGLAEVLKLMQKEGLQNLFERHAKLAEFCRVSLKNFGLTLFAESPSDAVTSAILPDDLHAPTFVKRLQSEYNIKIAGGQEHLKEKMIRIGHLGFIDYAEIRYTLDAIGELLELLRG